MKDFQKGIIVGCLWIFVFVFGANIINFNNDMKIDKKINSYLIKNGFAEADTLNESIKYTEKFEKNELSKIVILLKK